MSLSSWLVRSRAWLVLSAFALMSGAACVSTTSWQLPPQETHEEGGAPESAAIQVLRRQIERDPGDFDAYYNLAVELEQAGDVAGALRTYQRVALIEPRHIPAAVNLSALYRERGQFVEAKGVLSDLFDSGVDDPRARTDLAVLHRLTGDYLRSLEESREVLKRFGLVFGAKLNAGLVYYDLGNYEMALSLLNEMAGEFPDDPRVHFAIGRALEALENPFAAQREYSRAVSLDPDAFEAHNNLGVLHLLRREFPEAKRAFQRAITANVNYAVAWLNLGIVERNLENYRESDQAYRRAVQIRPRYREAYYNLALLYDDYWNRPDAAIQTWRVYLDRFGEELSEEARADIQERLDRLATRRQQMRADETGAPAADAQAPAPEPASSADPEAESGLAPEAEPEPETDPEPAPESGADTESGDPGEADAAAPESGTTTPTGETAADETGVGDPAADLLDDETVDSP